MQRMQEQMNQIAQTTDPQERQRLMQEHWQGMYQDMQTMRGMGWMWGGGPMMGPGMEPGMMRGRHDEPSRSQRQAIAGCGFRGREAGFDLLRSVSRGTPADLHTAKEWTSVTAAHAHRMDSGWQGIKTPTDSEMKTIVDYMQKHARK